MIEKLFIPVLLLLVGGNAYFVKRLVDQVDATQKNVWEVRQQVTLMDYKIEDLIKHTVRERRPASLLDTTVLFR